MQYYTILDMSFISVIQNMIYSFTQKDLFYKTISTIRKNGMKYIKCDLIHGHLNAYTRKNIVSLEIALRTTHT